MRPRKCQALAGGEVKFEGVFHRWADTPGGTFAIIEIEDGSVNWWSYDIKFLEPEHPRVEVSPPNKEPRQGELQGWFQYQDEDGGNPVALVRFDDGTFDTFPAWWVRFLKGGSDE